MFGKVIWFFCDFIPLKMELNSGLDSRFSLQNVSIEDESVSNTVLIMSLIIGYLTLTSGFTYDFSEGVSWSMVS